MSTNLLKPPIIPPRILARNQIQRAKVAVKKKYSFTFLRGLKQHTVFAEQIYALRRRTSQHGNASSDPVWFATNSVDSNRRPWTVLMFEAGELVGAVMLREQVRYRIPLGYFFACDAAGDEFVLAPKAERESCLRHCLEAFTRRMPSAVIFLATQADYSKCGWQELKSGSATGVALYRLPIKRTLDETLAQFGSHTRRNLRYYARNVLRDGATFVPRLSMAELAEATTQLHPASDYPIPKQGLKAIHAAIGRLEDGFSAGLRAADGQWLSLLTGWRENGRTSVFFQMNRASMRKASLSTAMRALLLEHEIALGTEDLVFVSYTSEVIERGCAKDVRHDLLIARPSWRLAIIARLAQRLPADHRLRVCVARSLLVAPGRRASLDSARAES